VIAVDALRGVRRGGAQFGALLAAIGLLLPLVGPADPAHAQGSAFISVDPQWDSVAVVDFSPYTELTVQVFDDASIEVHSGTILTGGDGSAEVTLEGVDLQPGMTVRVTEPGVWLRNLLIADLAIDLVDPDTDTVRGSVSPAYGTTVFLNLFVPDELILLPQDAQVTVTSGEWSWTGGASDDVTWHMHANAWIQDGDGDQTTIGKTPPLLTVYPQYRSFDAAGFLGDATLDVSVVNNGSEVFSSTATSDTFGFAEVHIAEEIPLVLGMVVNVSDATTTKELTVSDLVIEFVDLELDRVTGTVTPLPLPPAFVDVGFDDPTLEWMPPQVVAVDALGGWEAQFDTLTTNTTVTAGVVDEDGDRTQTQKPPPAIELSFFGFNRVGGLCAFPFFPRELVSFLVLDGTETVFAGTAPADETGEACIDQESARLVEIRMDVHVTNGVFDKHLAVEQVAINVVDPVNDLVTGIAEPGAWVNVNVNNTSGGAGEIVQATGAGTWTADFSGDLVDEFTDASAYVFDADGDSTRDEKFSRILSVGPTDGHLAVDQFAANTSVTFQVRPTPGVSVSPAGLVTTDSSGHAQLSVTAPIPAGYEVWASDGLVARSAVVPDFTIDTVDPFADEAAGTGPALERSAVASHCGLTEDGVQAGADGNWSLTGYSGDIQDLAAICTSAAPGVDMLIARSVPIISVDPSRDVVTVDGFGSGNVTLEIWPDAASALDSPLVSADVITGPVAEDNKVRSGGHADLAVGDSPYNLDLTPGMFVRATQGSTVKALTIAAFSIDVADPLAKVVSGTADNGSRVVVSVDLQLTQKPTVVSGAWQFGTGDYEWGLTSRVEGSVVDADGDRTAVVRGAAEEVAATVVAGATVTTDVEDDGATSEDPVETWVTSPSGGTITISEEQQTQVAPNTFAFLGQEIDIDAPVESASDPLVIRVRVDATRVPAHESAATVQVFRNGNYVPDCLPPSSGTPSPDPCIALREDLSDGDVQITLRSSQASDWNAGASNDARPPELGDADVQQQSEAQVADDDPVRDRDRCAQRYRGRRVLHRQ